MKYFPILQELFESDTVIFLIIGLIVSILMVLKFKSRKKLMAGIVIALLVYAVCEIFSNLRSNYMTELMLLFLGTAAIGCFIGFFVSCLFIRRGKDDFRKDKDDE